ncbi:hypothetical protein CIK05_01870 [Bdellovibrio sp. qaytius]|nr:hypothetical protein CIK05_01870 [Bdellovibrio sp. qaytius]
MNIQTNGSIMSIELPENLDNEFADLLQLKAKDWLSITTVELYAFNFNKTTTCKQSTYRSLITVSQIIRKAGRQIVSHNLDPELNQQFKLAGISDALNVSTDLDSYTNKVNQKKSGLDVQMINPFLEATLMTLEQTANTKCEAQKPQLIDLNEKSRTDDISIAGVISLTTEQFNGSITLAFPEVVFLKIYESMFGESVDKINEEIEDAAGELLNIIYGSAKTKLNEQCNFKLAPALPTILSGEKIKIRQTTYQKVIVLPFKTAFGFFRVEISFDPQK